MQIEVELESRSSEKTPLKGWAEELNNFSFDKSIYEGNFFSRDFAISNNSEVLGIYSVVKYLLLGKTNYSHYKITDKVQSYD